MFVSCESSAMSEVADVPLEVAILRPEVVNGPPKIADVLPEMTDALPEVVDVPPQVVERLPEVADEPPEMDDVPPDLLEGPLEVGDGPPEMEDGRAETVDRPKDSSAPDEKYKQETAQKKWNKENSENSKGPRGDKEIDKNHQGGDAEDDVEYQGRDVEDDVDQDKDVENDMGGHGRDVEEVVEDHGRGVEDDLEDQLGDIEDDEIEPTVEFDIRKMSGSQMEEEQEPLAGSEHSYLQSFRNLVFNSLLELLHFPKTCLHLRICGGQEISQNLLSTVTFRTCDIWTKSARIVLYAFPKNEHLDTKIGAKCHNVTFNLLVIRPASPVTFHSCVTICPNVFYC